ncbi:MAG: protein jag [Oscillospiraceae bacterium]|nr:protein jag [Oscillospiraceae bacterium]
MYNSVTVSGKTEEEAVAAALAQLGLEREDVSVEILERSKQGFLGLGTVAAVVKVTYEVTDSYEERAESFIRGLLERMGVEAELETTRHENGLNINLVGEKPGAVIGRRGETLDAIQHLANYAVNRGGEKHAHISVDAENYRNKREDSLVYLAKKMADKAIKYRRPMTLEPMNSYERHIVHTALQDYEGVVTGSTGTEPNRRVVVSVSKPDSGGKNDRKVREWS